jgi:hypothetical protein
MAPLTIRDRLGTDRAVARMADLSGGGDMAMTVTPTSAPLTLSIRAGRIDCPRAGTRPAFDCDGCPYLQGTLAGNDSAVLCGFLEPRLAIIRPLPLPEPIESRGLTHEQTRTSAAQRAPQPTAAQAPTLASTAARTGGAQEAPPESLIFYIDWPVE